MDVVAEGWRDGVVASAAVLDGLDVDEPAEEAEALVCNPESADVEELDPAEADEDVDVDEPDEVFDPVDADEELEVVLESVGCDDAALDVVVLLGVVSSDAEDDDTSGWDGVETAGERESVEVCHSDSISFHQ